ncbi:diaminobutyrate acetyltransferase [Lignipirellula cremea]|uniref:L-2,4-diaminobutyric acid acetyltransferase n=1 Tax=Lignipirellula cremea TaxID=2528010 RepID=A0A518DXW2_9BACT|nr:diaminobutyrate acetyltransferase [Lignipirellula cremea]QDU96688.1 L-2,4-diaminobutyric acid acetyltransferase [Lignipirellula cremea]
MTETSDPSSEIEIRRVRVSDGARIWQLVQECGVLDKNSCYAYLLVCRDFSATSFVAEANGQLLGFVAAYVRPTDPEAVFVWQIGAAPAARRRGVGKALLRAVLQATASQNRKYLEATITPSNAASMRLFQAIADERKTGCQVLPGFESVDFSPVQATTPAHEPENLVRIGPLEE